MAWPVYYLDEFISFTSYPSGESHTWITEEWLSKLVQHDDFIVIADEVRDFNGLMQCKVVENIFANCGITNHCWVVPFFPYARDDRRLDMGHGFELELALKIGHDLAIACIDPHSDVAGIRLHYTQAQVVAEWERAGLFPIDAIVAIPDAGAAKKVYAWAQGRDLNVVQCLKVRDPNTGKLSGFQAITDSFCGRPVVIVDDICDGGGTFIGLAEELKAKDAGELTLAVTHGLFTKGMKVLEEHFDRIFTLDIYPARDLSPDWQSDIVTRISTKDLVRSYHPV